MKRFAFFIFIIFQTYLVLAQHNKTTFHSDLIEWMSLEDALQAQKKQPKKIFIDIYTDWCGWCKVMSKKTFSNPTIANYINQNYYPVKYNAETTDTIEYLGKTYINKTPYKRRSINDLTLVLTQNRPSYPTIAYLDESGHLLQTVPGYMEANQLEPILIYITENTYKSADYKNFHKYFKMCYQDSLFKPKERVKWLSFEQAQKLTKSAPKPLLIDLYGNWSNTSKIMEIGTFSDSLTAQYINQHFYPIKLNVLEKDSIQFYGETFKNQSKTHPFHDLAVILCNKRISIPALSFINTEGKLITTAKGFRSPIELEALLMFFAENHYKKESWEQFMKHFKSKRP